MQQENSFTPQSSQQSWQPSERPTRVAKPWFKKPVVLVVVGLVLVVGAIGAGRLTNKLLIADEKKDNKAAVVNPSLTLYYRDGKTPLWSSESSDDKTNPAPAFAIFVRNELKDRLGESELDKSEVRVTTTLDLSLQQVAREQMLAQKDQLAKQRAEDATFVAQDATSGQIVSFVDGWRDISGSLSSEYSLSKIEVGTLMLPFDYALYLEKHPAATADTQFDDASGPLAGGFPCDRSGRPTENGNCLYNLDYKYEGMMSLRQALASVRLVPAVKAVVGDVTDTNHADAAVPSINEVIALTKKMGGDPGCYVDLITRDDEAQCYGAALFGNGLHASPTSMLQAYATLTGKGIKTAQTSILAMSVNGDDQADLQPESERALSEKTAQTLTDVLQDAGASYIKSASFAFTTNKGLKTGAMTGVEPDGQSSGAVQFSSRYIAGFWVRSGEQGLAGPMERPMYSVTSNWLDATQ